MVKFRFLIPELWDFIHQIVGDFSYVTLQIENPLANSLQISQGIGIDSFRVCLLYGEISNFHSRVMGLYSSNCRRFFVCRAVN